MGGDRDLGKPVVVLALDRLPFAVPVLELAADSEVAGGVVVNADVSAWGDWQAGMAQSSRDRRLSRGRMISSSAKPTLSYIEWVSPIRTGRSFAWPWRVPWA